MSEIEQMSVTQMEVAHMPVVGHDDGLSDAMAQVAAMDDDLPADTGELPPADQVQPDALEPKKRGRKPKTVK